MFVTVNSTSPVIKNQTDGLPKARKHIETRVKGNSVTESSSDILFMSKNIGTGSIEEVPTIFGTHDVRLHQATFKMKEECFLDNNVMCEFGCLTNIKFVFYQLQSLNINNIVVILFTILLRNI